MCSYVQNIEILLRKEIQPHRNFYNFASMFYNCSWNLELNEGLVCIEFLKLMYATTVVFRYFTTAVYVLLRGGLLHWL